MPLYVKKLKKIFALNFANFLLKCQKKSFSKINYINSLRTTYVWNVAYVRKLFQLKLVFIDIQRVSFLNKF